MGAMVASVTTSRVTRSVTGNRSEVVICQASVTDTEIRLETPDRSTPSDARVYINPARASAWPRRPREDVWRHSQ